ncbi:MAG TPA: hypothetical protein V6C81_24240 [Planktothrix sp.]|jgi:hypothetical protein
MVNQTSDRAISAAQNTVWTPTDGGATSAARSANTAEGQSLYKAATASTKDTSQKHVTNLQIGSEHVKGADGNDMQIWRDKSGNVTQSLEHTKDGGKMIKSYKYDPETNNMTSAVWTETDKNNKLTYGTAQHFDGKTGNMTSDYHQFADGTYHGRKFDADSNLVSSTDGDANGNKTVHQFNNKGQETDRYNTSQSTGINDHQHFVSGHLSYKVQSDALNHSSTTTTYDPNTHHALTYDKQYGNGSSTHMQMDPNTDIVVSQTSMDKSGNGTSTTRDSQTGKVTHVNPIRQGHIVNPGLQSY